MAANYRNAIDGRVYNTGFREKNAGGTLGYASSAGLSVINATFYENLQGIPDGSRDSVSRRFTKQVHEGENDDIRQRPVVSEKELRSYKLSPLHQLIQHYRLYSNNRYAIAGGELDASVGFQQNIRREYNHPTVPAQPGLYVRLNTFSYGVKYLMPSFNNFQATIGINGMQQQNKSRAATDFPVPDYSLADLGGYLYGKWKCGRLITSGGIRYDVRQMTIPDFYTGINPQTGFGVRKGIPDTAGAKLQFPQLHKTYTGMSFSIGMSYEFSRAVAFKANVARGYRSPNITEIASNGLDPGAHIIYLGNRTFTPEFSFQQDLGISVNLESLSGSVSIFHNSISGYIYLSQLSDAGGNAVQDAQGNKTFQYQQSGARLYGAEATLQLHPASLKNLEWSNSFSFTNGENTNDVFSGKGIYGQYLSLIPPLKFFSELTRKIQLRSKTFSAAEFAIEAEYNARQDRFMALYNTETATPGYTLFGVSAQIGVPMPGNHTLQLRAQVSNVFNKAYQSHLSRLKYLEYYSSSPGGHAGIYNMGRNISIKAIMAF